MSESKFIGLLQFFNFVFKSSLLGLGNTTPEKKENSPGLYRVFIIVTLARMKIKEWSLQQDYSIHSSKNSFICLHSLKTSRHEFFFFLKWSSERSSASLWKCFRHQMFTRRGWDSTRKDGWGIHIRGRFSQKALKFFFLSRFFLKKKTLLTEFFNGRKLKLGEIALLWRIYEGPSKLSIRKPSALIVEDKYLAFEQLLKDLGKHHYFQSRASLTKVVEQAWAKQFRGKRFKTF